MGHVINGKSRLLEMDDTDEVFFAFIRFLIDLILRVFLGFLFFENV